MKKHVCIIGGYVYDQNLPFDELPDDYETTTSCPSPRRTSIWQKFSDNGM